MTTKPTLLLLTALPLLLASPARADDTYNFYFQKAPGPVTVNQGGAPAQAANTAPAAALAPAPALAPVSTAAEPVLSERIRNTSFGVATGYDTFGGNIGKLYDSSGVPADLRFNWSMSPLFVTRVGLGFGSFSFHAEPNGATSVHNKTLSLALENHFLSTAQSSTRLDPYLFGGGLAVWRNQNFEDMNMAENDSAFGFTAGLGLNCPIGRGEAALWLEASANDILFKDRQTQEYMPVGIPDTTGLLYSFRLGAKIYF